MRFTLGGSTSFLFRPHQLDDILSEEEKRLFLIPAATKNTTIIHDDLFFSITTLRHTSTAETWARSHVGFRITDVTLTLRMGEEGNI